MMRKKLLTAVLTVTMVLAMSMTALAFVPVVGWKSEQLGGSTHWHYDKTGYGEFAHDEWLWIDGNGDGIAECYNFDGTSFMRANTTTPDGYTVNADGAWTVDGVVQTKQVGQETAQQPEPEQNNVQPVNLLDMTPVSKDEYKVINSGRTNQGALWSNVAELINWAGTESHAQFYTAKQYSNLTMTVAPRTNYTTNANYIIEIYGDNDSLLYTSDDIIGSTSPFEISVDITGQEYVNIVLVQNKIGGGGGILIKDAVLK